MPHLLANGHSAFVLFYLRAANRPGDADATIASPDGRGPEPLALIEFTGVHAVLFGGLERYAIHEVRASRWISQAERVNSVHPYHQGGWYAWLRHFVITFHDETLECLARDVRTEISPSSYRTPSRHPSAACSPGGNHEASLTPSDSADAG